jgi:hypothetical protein
MAQLLLLGVSRDIGPVHGGSRVATGSKSNVWGPQGKGLGAQGSLDTTVASHRAQGPKSVTQRRTAVGKGATGSRFFANGRALSHWEVPTAEGAARRG